MLTEEQKQKRREWARVFRLANRDAINANTREKRRLLGPPPSEAKRRKGHPEHDEYLRELSIQQKAYKQKNSESVNAKRRAYNALPKNRERIRLRKNARQHKDKVRKYGLSTDDYAAMLSRQNGVCAICQRPETLRHFSNGRVKNLGVDHDHKTGAVRGLLCAACNVGIGNLDEDVKRMRAAIAYIEKHRQGVLKLA